MRRLLTPGWLALHAVGLAALVLCVALGRWQWQRGAATGSVQNWFYGVEWWLFGAFVVAFWVRLARDTLRGPDAAPPADGDDATAPSFLAPRTPPPADAPDDDPEVAAYNAYLAWLAQNPRR